MILNGEEIASHFYHSARQLLWDGWCWKCTNISCTNRDLGREAAALIGPDYNRLQATEMKFLRSRLHKTRKDKIRNKEIHQQRWSGMESLRTQWIEVLRSLRVGIQKYTSTGLKKAKCPEKCLEISWKTGYARVS